MIAVIGLSSVLPPSRVRDGCGRSTSRTSRNGNPIGGIKVIARDGWFAARPSGTEEIYKIYAERFLGQDHLRKIQQETQSILSETLARSARAF
jgi:phosphoglucomutase